MLRVLILTPYARPHTGGVTAFVDYLVEALTRRRDIRCQVIAREGDTQGIVIGCGGSVWRFMFQSFAYIIRRRPGIVHAHSHWYALLPATLGQALGLRPRLVYSFHTMLPEGKEIRFRFLFEVLLNRCDVITFQSQALRSQIEARFHFNASATCLHPGVALAEIGLRKEPPAGSVEHTVGFAGPLVWPAKAAGLFVLIDALALVAKEIPQVQLVVAGSGSFEGEAKRRAQAVGVDDRVRFLGDLPSLEGFWPLLDVYAHISLQEGLPLALLEAMSHAKPVIANCIGGIAEVLEDRKNGILVPPQPGPLALVLVELLQDSELRTRLGNEARRTIQAHFGLDEFATRVLSIYAPVAIQNE